jgi:UDP-N-acetylmuramate--alanine ligase
MLALVMIEAGLRPSFIVGGELNEAGTGAVWEDGEWFVVEADESDGTFLELGAEGVVVTSIEADHLDRYGTLDNIVTAFRQLITDAAGPVVVSADDPITAQLGRERGAVTYGTDPDADYRISQVQVSRAATSFTVTAPTGEEVGIELPVPGLHNARNATAALATAHLLGAPLEAAQRALARYGGVARRFQFRGERDGVTFVDDYAHNPGKVRAVLEAAAAGGWRRVVCVFQPHLYSRTADLAHEFADAFTDADVLILTDIYGAREAPRPGVTGKLLVDAVLDRHPRQRVAYLPARSDLAPYLRRTLRPGDLCLTLGAGDLTSLPDEMLAEH